MNELGIRLPMKLLAKLYTEASQKNETPQGIIINALEIYFKAKEDME